MNIPANSNTISSNMVGILQDYVPESIASGILNYAFKKTRLSAYKLDNKTDRENLINQLQQGLNLFIDNEKDRQACVSRLCCLIENPKPEAATAGNNLPTAGQQHDATIEIKGEGDIVMARKYAKDIAESIGFVKTDQIKVATSVSELARNIYKYAGKGSIQIENVRESGRSGIKIVAKDSGPGIKNIDVILSGKYKSKTGLGLGILGCKRLMDNFHIQTSENSGTQLTLTKYL